MNIIITKPQDEEIDIVKDVTEKAYKEPYHENSLITQFKEADDLREKFVNGEIGIVVARINDQIVGSVRYKIKETGELYLFKLAVLKEFRKNGIASKLLLAIEEEARRINILTIKLDCAQEKFLPPFYERHGYKIDEIREHGDHHDVYMSKVV